MLIRNGPVFQQESGNRNNIQLLQLIAGPDVVVCQSESAQNSPLTGATLVVGHHKRHLWTEVRP
jgi:hypothetical protein